MKNEILLKVQELSISEVSGAELLNRVSIELRPGEIVGLAGESGSGKSLLCRAVMNLLSSDLCLSGGEIHFRGERIDGRKHDLYGRELTMVFQEPTKALHPLKTIGEQIAEVLKLHTSFSRAEIRQKVLETMALVGIDEPEVRYRQYPHQLSGGLCQRAVIAIAVIRKPSLLLADEPTTSLDVTVQKKILELLSNLNRTMGTSVLLVSHDLAVLSQICDRVYVMYAGQIVEEGTVPKIFTEPKHPYNRALLASMPKIDRPEQPILPIEGRVPRPAEYSNFCRFYDRCGERTEFCRERTPKWTEGGDQSVRCIRYE